MKDSKHIVISLGGSLIVPDEIDVAFLNSFIGFVKEYVDQGYRFMIITGGGKVCRRYQKALTELIPATIMDLDWLGIYATQLNAQFLRLSFGDLAHEKIITDKALLEESDKPVIIGSGHVPGASTDLATVTCAEKLGAQRIINLSNIDYAYDKDPRTNPDAVKIEESNWADFRKILPTEWNPGLNAPFDPIAAEKAESLGLEVAIMNGKNIQNLKDYIDGKAFIGTVIK